MRRDPARARRWTLIGIVIGAMAVSGCATSKRDEDAAEAGRLAQTLLVLPLNVTVSMPEGLGDQSVAVWKEIEVFLGAQNKQLKTVPYADARRLWKSSIARAKSASESGSANYKAAASLFARELRRHAEFDALIAPSLFVQEATLIGAEASWDGVKRPLEIHSDNRRIRSRTVRSSSTARCASLHVTILDATGRTIHEGQGGLDLLERARVDADLGHDMSSNVFWYFETLPLFFDDPAELRDGIEVAFKPFFASEGILRTPL